MPDLHNEFDNPPYNGTGPGEDALGVSFGPLNTCEPVYNLAKPTILYQGGQRGAGAGQFKVLQSSICPYFSSVFPQINAWDGLNSTIIQDDLTILQNHSTTLGSLYYECNTQSTMKANMSLLYKEITETDEITASYDFYYGSININVSDNFNSVSVYCYYHGYMGGKNLLEYSNSCSSS